LLRPCATAGQRHRQGGEGPSHQPAPWRAGVLHPWAGHVRARSCHLCPLRPGWLFNVNPVALADGRRPDCTPPYRDRLSSVIACSRALVSRPIGWRGQKASWRPFCGDSALRDRLDQVLSLPWSGGCPELPVLLGPRAAD
jgi:hypothetical protein